LGNADPALRAAALEAVGSTAAGDAPAALVAAVVALRADPAVLDDDPYTVGNAARNALAHLSGAEATTTLVAELQDAPPPDAGPAFSPCRGAAWRIRAAAALLERAYPDGLSAAAALVAAREKVAGADYANDLEPLITALGASHGEGTEGLLVRLLAAPDRLDARLAVLALQVHAQHQPLAETTIAALDACVRGPGAWSRIAARSLLDRTALSKAARAALAASVVAAVVTYGPKAFFDYQSPSPPAPQQPVAKPGADDF
ncbi:MAG: hypothetical protein H0X38_18595, partial [Planctomycetes bacterium]|nr:hypothetical protein [Planctomycetota bacterium]